MLILSFSHFQSTENTLTSVSLGSPMTTTKLLSNVRGQGSMEIGIILSTIHCVKSSSNIIDKECEDNIFRRNLEDFPRGDIWVKILKVE